MHCSVGTLKDTCCFHMISKTESLIWYIQPCHNIIDDDNGSFFITKDQLWEGPARGGMLSNDIKGTWRKVLLDPALVLPFIISSLLLPLVLWSQNLVLLFLLLITMLHGFLQAVSNVWGWCQPESTGPSVSLSSIFLEPLCLVFHLIAHLGFMYQAYRRHGQTIIVSASAWPPYWEDWLFPGLHCWFYSPAI